MYSALVGPKSGFLRSFTAQRTGATDQISTALASTELEQKINFYGGTIRANLSEWQLEASMRKPMAEPTEPTTSRVSTKQECRVVTSRWH